MTNIYSSGFDDTICIPSGIAGVHFEKMFGMPGQPKSAEYLLLAGPLGKYLLDGSMHKDQQAAVFEYLDLLGIFWEKSITEARLQHMETQMAVVLTKLETVLPAWELDMNRHMMLHMAHSIRRHGPCWCWSMFGFERMWGRLTRWMTQTSHPEATMVNSWKAFVTCCQALPDRAAELEDLTNPRASAQSAATLFHYLPETFDRTTYQLELPTFLQPNASTRITMYDALKGRQRFGSRLHKDWHRRRPELHLFYLKFPKLCKSCDCTNQSNCTCLDYAQLWDRFLQHYLQGGYSQPTKDQLPVALDDWATWAENQGDLSEHLLWSLPQLATV